MPAEIVSPICSRVAAAGVTKASEQSSARADTPSERAYAPGSHADGLYTSLLAASDAAAASSTADPTAAPPAKPPKPSYEATASFFSRLFFTWCNPILSLGYSRGEHARAPIALGSPRARRFELFLGSVGRGGWAGSEG